eukprot:scaffold1077_cov191-Alexandrium_tamarense.AAC.15
MIQRNILTPQRPRQTHHDDANENPGAVLVATFDGRTLKAQPATTDNIVFNSCETTPNVSR